jgi:hypothetical protein
VEFGIFATRSDDTQAFAPKEAPLVDEAAPLSIALISVTHGIHRPGAIFTRYSMIWPLCIFSDGQGTILNPGSGGVIDRICSWERW